MTSLILVHFRDLIVSVQGQLLGPWGSWQTALHLPWIHARRNSERQNWWVWGLSRGQEAVPHMRGWLLPDALSVPLFSICSVFCDKLHHTATTESFCLVASLFGHAFVASDRKTIPRYATICHDAFTCLKKKYFQNYPNYLSNWFYEGNFLVSVKNSLVIFFFCITCWARSFVQLFVNKCCMAKSEALWVRLHMSLIFPHSFSIYAYLCLTILIFHVPSTKWTDKTDLR